jgi:hypothetical protein
MRAATHLGFLELDDGVFLLVEFGFEVCELLATILDARLSLLDRLADRLGLLLGGGELLAQVGDFGLELFRLGRVCFDSLGRFRKVLFRLGAFRLGLDQASLVMPDLLLQVRHLCLLTPQFETADFFDFALQRRDLLFVLEGLAAERLELAVKCFDRLLELSDPLDVARVGLALRSAGIKPGE